MGTLGFEFYERGSRRWMWWKVVGVSGESVELSVKVV